MNRPNRCNIKALEKLISIGAVKLCHLINNLKHILMLSKN